VVPHGPLHAVPFHALGPAGDTLIDRVAVTVAPSLGVRSQCAARRTDSARTVVVGQAQDDLPGIGEEVAALGRAIPGAVILEDAHATLDAVAEAASGAECLHLASHGIFRPEAPLQSGVRLADGWLTALRASRLGLNGALVVLSCCDTARTTVSAGEELLGLQRGFMQAGARNVVMSLWPTPDLTTGDLMVAFHDGCRSGLRPVEALRAAQLGVRAEHPHPWWWAPFIVAGAG
jgi:CHAT domain-containing protein